MSVIRNTVRGAIKLDGLPERTCFESWEDFIQAIPQFLAVEVPASVTNVVISASEPSEDDRNKLWIRRDLSGQFIGLYQFQQNQWRPFYNVAPQEVVWMYGNSANVPSGFVLIEAGDAAVPPDVVNVLTAQYVPDGGGNFLYFATRWVGF